MALLRFCRMPLFPILALAISAMALPAIAAAGDASPGAVVQTPPHQVVKMRLVGQKDGTPKLGNGNSESLEPCDGPPEKLLEEPKYRSKRPIFYAARFGDGKDSVYTLVLDESTGPGKGYDTVYLDANHDHRIDAEKERFRVRVGTPTRADSVRVQLQVTSGGVTAPYFVSLSAVESSDDKFPMPRIRINLRDSSYYLGEAVFGGKTCRIALADLNSNGRFNDVERELADGDRLFVDLAGDGRFYPSLPYGGLKLIAGQWYSIVASPDGGRVEITAAKPPLGKVEAPEQIAAARLNSAGQSLELDFQEGPDVAVAGTYRVHSVHLVADSGWALPGTFPDGEPELTVREGETARLVAGLPLKVEPQVVADEDRTLRIHLRLTGIGGETYAWAPRRGSSAQAGFEIFDASGRRLFSGGFEYG